MSASPPASGSGATENIATGAFMPLVSLRRHWRRGAQVAGVILLLGLPIAWIKGKPVYSATAVIYVAPRFVNILQEGSGQEIVSYQQYRQFVEQQARTVGRYDVLLDALQSMGERRNVWQLPGETERRAAERLQAALTITPVKDTYLITVELESKQAEGLDEVVNTIIETYLHKARQEDLFYAADQRLANLRSQRASLVKGIEKNNQRKLEIAEELGVTTFSENNVNPFDQLIADSRTALAAAQRDRITATARAEAYDGARRKEGTAALRAATAELANRDGGLFSLKANLHQRKTKLIEQFAGLNPDHPLYPQIQNELQDIDAELEGETKRVTDSIGTMLVEQRQADARLAQQIERRLSENLDQDRKKAVWFAQRYSEALQLTAEIARDRSRLDAIDKRINYFELESDAPGFIRFDTPARPPEIPVSGGKKKPLMMVMVVAALFGCGVPIGIDMLDRRIKTAGQVHKLLGYPPLATIFKHSELPGVRRVIADQIRRLILALSRERRGDEPLTVVLTEAKAGAGITTLAFDIAIDFDQIGLKTLVVETNPLVPDLRYTGGHSSIGLLDLLTGETTDIFEAIVPAEGALPDRLPIGLPVHPHLFAYDRLTQILATLGQRYAVILLDTPPVLLSADSEFLAGMADVTLLVIAASQLAPGELKRAARILEKCQPRVISFIVTQLEVRQGGGYYSKMVEEYNQAEDSAIEAVRSHHLTAVD